MSIFVLVKGFNPLHLALMSTMPIFIVASYFIFHKRSEKAKDIYIWCVMAVVFCAYIASFIADCFFDPRYKSEFLGMLPLHLCGINVFLYPIFFSLKYTKFKKAHRIGMAYSYFVGSAGALLGAVMPNLADGTGNIFRYNVMMYYLKHCACFCLPVIIVALKIFTPSWSDMARAAIMLFAIVSVMHLVNLGLSAIGGYRVNYFFTRFPDGNPILELANKLIRVEYFYLYPLFLVLTPIFFCYYLPFLPCDLKKRRERLQSESRELLA